MRFLASKRITGIIAGFLALLMLAGVLSVSSLAAPDDTAYAEEPAYEEAAPAADPGSDTAPEAAEVPDGSDTPAADDETGPAPDPEDEADDPAAEEGSDPEDPAEDDPDASGDDETDDPTEKAPDPSDDIDPDDDPVEDSGDDETDPDDEDGDDPSEEPEDEEIIDETGEDEEIIDETEEITEYGDMTADVETAAYWASMFAGIELTGDYGTDVVTIALTQLGYCESVLNYIMIDEDMYGYSRYGAWYGVPYGDWCCMFASFCLFYAGVPQSVVPYSAGVDSWIAMLNARGMFAYSGDYIPKPGDLVFFDWEPDYNPDHVGIVEYVICDDNGVPVTLVTIEGNSGDMVRENSYSFYDARLYGYGILPGNTGTFSHIYGCSVPAAVLNEIDFSSHRLLLRADDGVITDDTFILAEYDGLVLALFRSTTETRNAFSYYIDLAEVCAPDSYLLAAEDDGMAFESAGLPDVDGMTLKDNPFADLSYTLLAERRLAAQDAASDDASEEADDDRFRVALVDTGVDDDSIERFTVLTAAARSTDDDDTLFGDPNGHGSRMLACIREEDPNADVLSVKALDADGATCVSLVIAAIALAQEHGADVICLPMSGYSVLENAALTDAIARAADEGVVVVAAAGNSDDDAALFTPGSSAGAVTVGAISLEAEGDIVLHGPAVAAGDRVLYHRAVASLAGSSNYGSVVDWYVTADTTSEAAARLAGMLSLAGTASTDFLSESDRVAGGAVLGFDGSADSTEALAPDGAGAAVAGDAAQRLLAAAKTAGADTPEQ